MDIDFFKIIGSVGLFFISIGILIKKRTTQDILYILGGISLEIYSLYLEDMIFIILQIFFIASAIYDLLKIRIIEKL
jgi:lipid-A-disaccharide synthase-like uncharacterized protein